MMTLQDDLDWFYQYGIDVMKALAQQQLPVIDPDKETFEDDCNHIIYNVHRREDCEGPCVIHNPSDHHMRNWTLLWRNDRALFERLCPTHGTGHPDPDHLAGQRYRGRHSDDVVVDSVHGCCGCCVDHTRQG